MAAKQQPITPQLVRQIADKVYRLWLRELEREQERQGHRKPAAGNNDRKW